MTAMQILEKLGADASFNPSHLSNQDKDDIAKLTENAPEFNAPLILSNQHPGEEPEEEEKEQKEDEGQDNRTIK